LDIPLRYPIRLGGSRSYVQDYAPSVEPSIIESGSFGMGGLQKPVVEFPLFLEGQDPTRSAYAVFLLNKVWSFTLFCILFSVILCEKD
jgi:hypothetical protein